MGRYSMFTTPIYIQNFVLKLEQYVLKFERITPDHWTKHPLL